MINMTPNTPSQKMEEDKKLKSVSKDKQTLKPKKTANSIKKEKTSKAQKPNSAKKPSSFGNIKNMFDKMSKPKIEHIPEENVQDKK